MVSLAPGGRQTSRKPTNAEQVFATLQTSLRTEGRREEVAKKSSETVRLQSFGADNEIRTHKVAHTPLKRARLPIPPCPRHRSNRLRHYTKGFLCLSSTLKARRYGEHKAPFQLIFLSCCRCSCCGWSNGSCCDCWRPFFSLPPPFFLLA